MKKTIHYIFILGLIGSLFGCQKKDAITEMSATVVSPTITNLPSSVTFTTAMSNDTFKFLGTKTKPGFQVSATYYLEVDTAGDNFNNAVILTSAGNDSVFAFSIAALNSQLLNDWNPYVVNTLNFRIRAVFDHSSAGSTVPVIMSISPTYTVNFTIYGFPQYNLIGGKGMIQNQNIQSPASNSTYSGLVKLDSAVAFTFSNPSTGTKYGYAGGKLVLNSSNGLTVDKSGWYLLTIDTAALSATALPYMVGIIGTFNNWGTPDQKLDYNRKSGAWYTTITLSASDQFKFRMNDNWNGAPTSLNIGASTTAAGPYTSINNTGGSNILSPGGGTWFVTLTFSSTAATAACTCTMTLVNK